MNIDRFVNWLFTACVLLIIIVVTGQIIDNLRVAINMTLIIIAFLFSGCVVYESISYIYKKIKYKKTNKKRIMNNEIKENCEHYEWYNDESGQKYCLKCNTKLDKLER